MPIFRRISLLSEKSSSADKPASLSIDSRVWLLRIILSSGCLIGLLLSMKLWLSAREYPLSPVSDWLPIISPPFDHILYISLLVLLLLIAIVARPFKYIAGFLLLAVSLSLLDQSRWQPWFYQYLFMLAALGLCFKGSSETDRQQALLNTCRLIVAAIYFWSGMQKINATFVNQTFPSLINPYLNFIFGDVNVFPRWVSLSVPLLEISIGIGLLTRKFRETSVSLAILIHVLILLLLIPVRRNSVVWPWNIAMAGFVVVLFWRAGDFSIRDVLLPRKLGFQTVVVVLFGLMPLFSHFNLWDSYLSSTLYSGNIVTAVIYVNEATMKRLPPGIQGYARQSNSGDQSIINPNGWSLAELNVPCYPEKRIFINVAKRICAFADAADPSGVQLLIYGKPHWLNGHRETFTYNCSDL
jgi:hypothetical protein